MKKRLFGELFLVAVVISAMVFCVKAQSGSLDSTFGSGGVVTGNIGGSPSFANKVVVQPFCPNCVGPKLVAAVNGPGNTFYVVRYNLDGSIDTSFGNSGISQIKMSPDSTSEDPRDLVVQADGKIVVGGGVRFQQSRNSIVWFFGVTRLDANGTLDTSFANGGRLLFNFSNGVSAAGADLAIQPNGSIVLAGTSGGGFAVARLLSNGNFDPSFNGTGKTIINVGRNGGSAASVKIDANGGIVIGGQRNGSGNASGDSALVRLNPVNGNLDSNFGSGTGMVFTDFNGNNDFISDLVIDGAGRIVAAGYSFNTKTGLFSFAATRYLVNGQLDPSFNGTGKFIFASPGYQQNLLASLAIDSLGRIIAAGKRASPSSSFAVLRLNPDGTFDQSFGGTGAVYTSITNYDSASSMAIQPDGKIIVAGCGGGCNSIALARYLP